MAAEGNKPTVLVTGFGPFGMHEVNTSWLAVQELPKTSLTEKVNLEIREIPVEYDAVDKEVPALWKEVKPKVIKVEDKAWVVCVGGDRQTS